MHIIEPTVVTEEMGDAMARVTLRVPEDLAFLKGHFPNYPVVPGFVQIDWVVRFARHCFTQVGAVNGLKSIKFRDMLRPNATFSLQLHLDEAERAVHFEIMGEHSRYSRGIILFEPI